MNYKKSNQTRSNPRSNQKTGRSEEHASNLASLTRENNSKNSKAKSSKRVALLTQFNGTNYAGWQRQNNAPSVQAELEQALTKLLKEEIKVVGASRTDAGVHALRHVCHFDSQNLTIPADRIHLAMNNLLPEDIVVLDAAIVDKEFNARFSCQGKKYSYYIWNNSHKNAFIAPFSLQESRKLDLAAMQKASEYFLGEHDFKAFMSQGSEAKTTVRKLSQVEVKGEVGGLIRIDVAGTAFLYNMVRIIAGTLLYVGLGKIKVADIPAIILAGQRELAGETLPPQGLFLDEIYYANGLFSDWQNQDVFDHFVKI